jgi:CubicO group peptidase (beta-lactamase class C family)
MQADGTFRIMSMTRPIVGMAIMIPMEEGKVRLTDPASKLIPELKGLKVAIALPPPSEAGQDNILGLRGRRLDGLRQGLVK